MRYLCANIESTFVAWLSLPRRKAADLWIHTRWLGCDKRIDDFALHQTNLGRAVLRNGMVADNIVELGPLPAPLSQSTSEQSMVAVVLL